MVWDTNAIPLSRTLPDVFSKGIWPEVYQIDGPDLKSLAKALPAIALRSKAPATVKKYAGGFSRWKKWAITKPGIDIFLAKPSNLH